MNKKPRKGKVRWFKNPKPVVILWHDAQSIAPGWQEPAEVTKWAKDEATAMCRSIGYLMGKSKRYLIVGCCNQNDGDYFMHCQRIPKGCVRKRWRLK